MRYSVKIAPGVRVYGGRRMSRSERQAVSGCTGAVIGLAVVLAALALAVAWPLFVFRHHWVTRAWVSCSSVNAPPKCLTAILATPRGEWTTVQHSGPTAFGVVIEVVWAALLLAGMIALAVKQSSRTSAAPAGQISEAHSVSGVVREFSAHPEPGGTWGIRFMIDGSGAPAAVQSGVPASNPMLGFRDGDAVRAVWHPKEHRFDQIRKVVH